MIINWKKPGAGVKFIPLVNADGRIERQLTFLPGYNEISESDWNKARNHDQIKDYLKRGWFEEIGKVETVEVVKEVVAEDGKKEKVKEKADIIKEMKLSEIEPEKALEIVKDTYKLETLEAWKKGESRDEIRAAIATQIEGINKGDVKGGSVNVGS